MLLRVPTFIAILFIAVQGRELDPGPQTFAQNESTSTSAPNPQKRFATKEVTVLLTPTQINDLQSGKAELRSSHGEITINQLSNSQKRPYQNPQLAYHLENLNILKAPIIPELRVQQKQSGKQEVKKNENLSEKQNIETLSRFTFSQPETQVNVVAKNNQNNRNAAATTEDWRPFIPITEKRQEAPSLDEQLNEYWQKFFEQNGKQLKLTPIYQPENPQVPTHLQYASNFDAQKFAFDLEKALREKDAIENEKAKAQATAFANLPPVLIHKEVQITRHKPIPIIKQVNVPVPTPILVPIPEPYEVKVPHPYPVPVDILKHISVPVKAEQKVKPVSTNEATRNIPARNVYINVDSPLFYDWKN